MGHAISRAATSTNGTNRKAADNSSKVEYYRCSPCYLKVSAQGKPLKNFAFLCQLKIQDALLKTVNEELRIVR